MSAAVRTTERARRMRRGVFLPNKGMLIVKAERRAKIKRKLVSRWECRLMVFILGKTQSRFLGMTRAESASRSLAGASQQGSLRL
jgi:hypothetical protein